MATDDHRALIADRDDATRGGYRRDELWDNYGDELQSFLIESLVYARDPLPPAAAGFGRGAWRLCVRSIHSSTTRLLRAS